MNVCPICFTPKCEHRRTKIEIDDDILDTIKLLNDKGYRTAYCCAGHLDKSQPILIYVSFDIYAIREANGELPQTLPNENWVCYPRHIENHHLVWSKQLSPKGTAMYYFVKNYRRKKPEVIQAELEEQRRALHEWALGLK